MSPKRSVHIATVKRTVGDKTYVSHLLRHSYREDGKVKHLTLGNLSDLPEDLIELMRKRLAGEPMRSGDDDKVVVRRSLPHGHVAAVLGTLRKIGLDRVIASRKSRQSDLVIALIVQRILMPGSKLTAFMGLQEETVKHTLAEELGLCDVELSEVYEAMDWLLSRQKRIQNKLAKKHLTNGTLVLYDVSSSYYTGRQSELVKFGYNRDGKKGRPQIVYGLLCAPDGCPVAIEVYAGNTTDSTTVSDQIERTRKQFGLSRIVLVGDRGMITSKAIREDYSHREGFDWITALRSSSLKKLLRQETIQPSLFDERDLAEVTSDDYPGERLIVCRNPLLADERTRKREELLLAAEKKLEAIVRSVSRKTNPLRGKDKIGLKVGETLKGTKMKKHFELTITKDSFSYARRESQIAEESSLDGIYVIRTSLEDSVMQSHDVVASYKSLSQVEWAFRSLKTVDLRIRPVFHWKDDRIKSHVFLCMLAYYVEWHMRQSLRPLLFDDHERSAAEAKRESIVGKAPRSEAAQAKESTRRTTDNLPVQSFQNLLRDMATLCRHRLAWQSQPSVEFNQLTEPTVYQLRVLDLLGLRPAT